MLVWLGQAVNSSVAPIRTKKTAAFFKTTMASPLMFVLISGEGVIIPNPRIRGLFSKPTNRLSGQVNPHALNMRVQVERVPAHLAAVARLFVTAEGRRCIEHVESVNPNNSGFDLF